MHLYLLIALAFTLSGSCSAWTWIWDSNLPAGHTKIEDCCSLCGPKFFLLGRRCISVDEMVGEFHDQPYSTIALSSVSFAGDKSQCCDYCGFGKGEYVPIDSESCRKLYFPTIQSYAEPLIAVETLKPSTTVSPTTTTSPHTVVLSTTPPSTVSPARKTLSVSLSNVLRSTVPQTVTVKPAHVPQKDMLIPKSTTRIYFLKPLSATE